MASVKSLLMMLVLICSISLLLPETSNVHASGFSSSLSGGGFKARTGRRSGSSSGSMSGLSDLGGGLSDSERLQQDAGLMYEHERREIERRREEERRNRYRRRAPDPPPRVAVPLPSGN